ncbi:hypothetical protein [Pontibacter liquoris]|nr:hypothetical protein [Pontibacter liquoris]
MEINRMHDQLTEFLNKASEEQRCIMIAVRDLLHATGPNVEESY